MASGSEPVPHSTDITWHHRRAKNLISGKSREHNHIMNGVGGQEILQGGYRVTQSRAELSAS